MARSGIIVKVDNVALREARTTALLTQRELADKVGMNHLQISRLETGAQNSTRHNLQKIADALNVDFRMLMKTGFTESS